MLNHVATLVGQDCQDQFYFFPLLLKNGYCIFTFCGDVMGSISRNIQLGLSVVFFMQNKLEGIKHFYINFIGKNCFLIRIFAIQTAIKNELSSNQEVPMYK